MNLIRKNQFAKIPRLFAVVAGTVVMCIGIVAMAQMLAPRSPSLYQAALARSLTQEERWRLDFDMVNEITMRDHNNYRFDAPGSFEKRAKWFEETAQWYPLADLMQQIIDFRKSTMRDNEKAFNQLVEMGQRGDIGAACIAALLYRNHRREVTDPWKYGFETVTREALKHEDSGHTVCLGTRGGLYMGGELGYPKDINLAKPYMMRSAVAGFYAYQSYMARRNIEGELRFNPNDFERALCWNRVSYTQAGNNSFPHTCESYLRGTATNENLKSAPLPAPLIEMSRQWCDSKRIVTAQTCADLEQKLDNLETLK